ncbi:MAG: Type 1 glutamine amidotransferase-like domain-containing protein [bacterium]|nr:Type 1 glutamine amidotransferase-like domain-containing protein [bacterium]
MKLLLTSGGLMNKSMVAALQKLAGKPFRNLNAIFIPTAANAEKGDKWWLIKDLESAHKLKFKNLDIVDIAALKPEWVKERVQDANIIFVGGGNTFYLSYWMQKSGLMNMFPELLKTRVYVGISAGSMAVTNSLRVSSQVLEKSNKLTDEEYDELGPKGQSSAKTARLVDFTIRPHLNSEWFPKIRLNYLSEIAKQIPETMYAIDDQTAIVVIDRKIEVISEGVWKKFN